MKNINEYIEASQDDYDKNIIKPYVEVPLTELVEGSLSHLVSTNNLTVSFLTMKANSIFDIHSHENEQLMIVIKGCCDEIIDDKLYHVKKGDVIYLKPNVPHGAFIGDEDCEAIDIFTPKRKDYLLKYQQQNNSECRWNQ